MYVCMYVYCTAGHLEAFCCETGLPLYVNSDSPSHAFDTTVLYSVSLRSDSTLKASILFHMCVYLSCVHWVHMPFKF